MQCQCVQCTFKWESRVDRPVQCPNCKRRDWDGVHDSMGRVIATRSITIRECYHCGYSWKPRKAGVTKECPQCKRKDWQAEQAAAGTVSCWYCMGAGCPVCRGTTVPVGVPTVALRIVACKRCYDNGMMDIDGNGCPVCGKVTVI